MSLFHHEASRAALTPGALHHLRATPQTVHWGYFDAALAPALRVKSGDLIQAEAITHHAGDAPELMMDAGVEKIFTDIPPEDRNPGVHIMTDLRGRCQAGRHPGGTLPQHDHPQSLRQ